MACTNNERPGSIRGEGRLVMLRFRLVLLSLFAVSVVGALASASASADSCAGGTQSVFCFSNNTPIHTEKILGEGGLTLLAGKVGVTETRFDCTHDLLNATLRLLGLATGEFDFLGCTVEKPAGQGCTLGEGVHKLISMQVHLQLSSGLMPATGLITGAGSGEELTSYTVAGASCSIAGTYKLTGLQTVEFPSGETSLVEHEIIAKKSGSKLKLGTETLSLSSKAKVHLASGSSWLIMLGA